MFHSLLQSTLAHWQIEHIFSLCHIPQVIAGPQLNIAQFIACNYVSLPYAHIQGTQSVVHAMHERQCMNLIARHNQMQSKSLFNPEQKYLWPSDMSIGGKPAANNVCPLCLSGTHNQIPSSKGTTNEIPFHATGCRMFWCLGTNHHRNILQSSIPYAHIQSNTTTSDVLCLLWQVKPHWVALLSVRHLACTDWPIWHQLNASMCVWNVCLVWTM